MTGFVAFVRKQDVWTGRARSGSLPLRVRDIALDQEPGFVPWWSGEQQLFAKVGGSSPGMLLCSLLLE